MRNFEGSFSDYIEFEAQVPSTATPTPAPSAPRASPAACPMRCYTAACPAPWWLHARVTTAGAVAAQRKEELRQEAAAADAAAAAARAAEQQASRQGSSAGKKKMSYKVPCAPGRGRGGRGAARPRTDSFIANRRNRALHLHQR